MSPATYNPKPATLHGWLEQLDGEGTAYWLEDLTLTTGKTIAHANVLDHSEDWLTLDVADGREDVPGHDRWTVRTAHIVCFRLMEG